jgi:ComF family protein
VVVAAHYEPPLKELIWEFKYGGRRDLATPLSGLLTEEVRLSRGQAIIPLPLARRREWWRGYNQARELTRALAGSLPVVEGLRRVRETKPQVELSRKERLVNLAGAFRAGAGLPARVLLIDDVATTGASLEAAARALNEAGVREIWAAVLARHK